ncbi:MAG: hypothetical protein RL260_2402 [Pseudomonadota bacterium]|jgi:hypothetical protein
MIGSVSDAPEVRAVEQPFQPLFQAETLEQALRTIVLVPSD